MKDARLWEEEDILNLISIGARESLFLEFKACESLINTNRNKTEISKDISSFANSAGGTIVYGLIENKNTHEAERIDEGYDPRVTSELWLEDVIQSNIQRRIDGLHINVVTLKATHPGKVLYVVTIPESKRAPHMAADSRFYRRFNFQSVPMQEYEVREQLRRETYPGKDIVEAWRDDAINPLISDLESEALFLRAEQWTWNRPDSVFAGLKEIGRPESFSPNAEDFIERRPEVQDLLGRHDAALTELNEAGKALFENVAKGSFIREVFAAVTSEESLEKLKADNFNRFKGTTAAEIYAELFSADRHEQERLDSFAEWAMNGGTTANVDPFVVFWRTYGHQFCNAVTYSDYRPNVQRAREKLLEIDLCMLSELKRIRKELSERHNVPVRAPRSSMDDPYTGLGW